MFTNSKSISSFLNLNVKLQESRDKLHYIAFHCIALHISLQMLKYYFEDRGKISLLNSFFMSLLKIA